MIKTDQNRKIKKINIFSPYETPDQPLWAAYISSKEGIQAYLLNALHVMSTVGHDASALGLCALATSAAAIGFAKGFKSWLA